MKTKKYALTLTDHEAAALATHLRGVGPPPPGGCAGTSAYGQLLAALPAPTPAAPVRIHVGSVSAIVYHRNGVAGVGFWHVAFESGDDDRPLVAVVLDQEIDGKIGGVCCFVTDPANPAACFRGDYFADELRDVLRIHHEKATTR